MPRSPPSQVPGLHVWYGPDTYMGRNLAQLFQSLAHMRRVGRGLRGLGSEAAGGGAGCLRRLCFRGRAAGRAGRATWLAWRLAPCALPGLTTHRAALAPRLCLPLSALCSDEEVRELHPDHTQASIRALLPRLRYFDQVRLCSGPCLLLVAVMWERAWLCCQLHHALACMLRCPAALTTPHRPCAASLLQGTCIVHHLFGGEVCELVK